MQVFSKTSSKTPSIVRTIILILSLLLLCSCASTSQKSAQLAQQNLANDNFDAAFNQSYDALKEDIKNKDAIAIFPLSYEKVVQFHKDKIEQAKQDNSWATVADEYDRVVEVNDDAKEIVDLIQHNYKDKLSNDKKDIAVFSALTSAFSAKKEDLKIITNLDIHNFSDEKNDAHEKASSQFYEEGQKLAQENNYRDASSKFGRALSYAAGYKDAQALKEKYTKLADEADAKKYYEEGQKLVQENNYRDASSKFSRALLSVAGYKDAQALKEKYTKLADEADAKKYYEEGQKLVQENNYRDASSKFSRALSSVAGYKDAQALKEKYTKLADEVDAKKYYEEGKRLMSQKEYSLAYDQLVKANEYIYSYKDVLTLIEESKNKMPPSEQEIIKAVERCLSRDGVPVSWVGNLLGGGKTSLSAISIQRIGIFNESQQYWPMIVRVQGSSLLNDPFNKGKRVSFDRNGDFRLTRDDYGDWQAFLKGGMFQ